MTAQYHFVQFCTEVSFLSSRMRLYIQRHGGVIDDKTLNLQRDREIQEAMLTVDMSKTEDWTADGFLTAGFWSRWLLWSHPTLPDSIRFIKKKFGIDVRIGQRAT